MNNEQFNSLKVGDIIHGNHKGRQFKCVIMDLVRFETRWRIQVRYDNGAVRYWAKHHIKKYYSMTPIVCDPLAVEFGG